MTSIEQRKSEITQKIGQLRALMARRELDGILLSAIPNTSWITAGAATYVNEAADTGPSSILVTTDRAYVLTDRVEGPRLTQEEKLADLGFEIVTEPWYERGGLSGALMSHKRIAQDSGKSTVDLSTDLRDLRSVFQDTEIERLRRVCKFAGDAMNETIRGVRPGQTEFEIAAKLGQAGQNRGGQPIVLLIASDERISYFRHPLPTIKPVVKYVMLVLCLRLDGLIASVTRLVYFGKLPDELEKKAMVVARVDAALIGGTKPGRTMRDMFKIARDAYEAEGYPEAINEHHQGGSAGYGAREVFALPADETPILVNQAFAWNPSVSGAKSEDTVLLGTKGIEVLTEIPGWPIWTVTGGEVTMARPAILEA